MIARALRAAKQVATRTAKSATPKSKVPTASNRTAGSKPATSPRNGEQPVLLGRDSNTDLFIAAYRMDIADKIRAIRGGVPAQRVGELASAMEMSIEALMDALGLSRATVNRRVQREQALSPEESERLIGVQALIGQVQEMIDDDLASPFNAAKWLASWLAAPLPALGGATPASFLDTVEGQKHVGRLLEMMPSGTYA